MCDAACYAMRSAMRSACLLCRIEVAILNMKPLRRQACAGEPPRGQASIDGPTSYSRLELERARFKGNSGSESASMVVTPWFDISWCTSSWRTPNADTFWRVRKLTSTLPDTSAWAHTCSIEGVSSTQVLNGISHAVNLTNMGDGSKCDDAVERILSTVLRLFCYVFCYAF